MRADEAGCAGYQDGVAGARAGVRRRPEPLFPAFAPAETPVVVGQQRVVGYEAQDENAE